MESNPQSSFMWRSERLAASPGASPVHWSGVTKLPTKSDNYLICLNPKKADPGASIASHRQNHDLNE
jgi:hypothetical protein